MKLFDKYRSTCVDCKLHEGGDLYLFFAHHFISTSELNFWHVLMPKSLSTTCVSPKFHGREQMGKWKNFSLRAQNRFHKIILRSYKMEFPPPKITSKLFISMIVFKWSSYNEQCWIMMLLWEGDFIFCTIKCAKCCLEHDNIVSTQRFSLNKMYFCSLDLSASLDIAATQFTKYCYF